MSMLNEHFHLFVLKKWTAVVEITFFLYYLCSKARLTTTGQEEDTEITLEDEESSNEIAESPRDMEVNRYNSTIHLESVPGQPYNR
jgi:hypothetical protein